MIQYLPLEALTTAQHIFQQQNTRHNHMQDNDEVQHHSNHDEQHNSPA